MPVPLRAMGNMHVLFLINMYHLSTSLKIYKSHLGNAMPSVNIKKKHDFLEILVLGIAVQQYMQSPIYTHFLIDLFESYPNIYNICSILLQKIQKKIKLFFAHFRLCSPLPPYPYHQKSYEPKFFFGLFRPAKTLKLRI